MSQSSSPINKAQFDICKSMQAIGIKPERFARATGAKPALMKQIWGSLGYSGFKKDWEMLGSIFGS